MRHTLALSFSFSAVSFVAPQAPAIPVQAERAVLFNLGDCLEREDARLEAMDYRAMCIDIAAASAPRVVTLPDSSSGPELVPEPLKKLMLKLPRARPIRMAAAPIQEPEISQNIPAALVQPVKLVEQRACVLDDVQSSISSSLGSGQIYTVDPTCSVKAPASGRVVYAGLFRGYEGLVILEVGKRQYLIIAGLGKIDVQQGQSVDQAQVLGASSSEASAALKIGTRTTTGRTLLYVSSKNATAHGQLARR